MAKVFMHVHAVSCRFTTCDGPTTGHDPAVQSAIAAAAAVCDVVAGNYGNQLTTQQLEKILRVTGYGMPPETLNLIYRPLSG